MSPRIALLFARFALALTFAWFGAMNFTVVGAGMVESWIAGHALLSGMAGQAESAAWAIGIYQIVAAALVAAPLPGAGFRRIGLAMIGLFSAAALTLLFTNPVWIEEAGGFPAIGNGQDILKYLTVLGLTLWTGSFENSRMFTHRPSEMRDWSQPAIWAGLILVIGWIGAMKLTAVEAAGIEPLIRTSPFFAWSLNFVPVQTVSYVIGAIELLTAAALLGFWFNVRLYRLGLLAAGITFAVTLSFLASYPGAWSGGLGGFPALSPAGHFLLKDIILLAAVLALLAETGREGTRHRRRR